MKRTITALLIAVAALALTGCATAQADAPEEKPAVEFAYVHDWAEPKVPSGMVRIKQEMDEKAARAAESAPEAPIEATADSQTDYWDGNYYSGPYDPELNNNPAYIGGGDGFYSQGVRAGVDSQTETYYSSAVAYHYRTGEWHTDDEGYWRDADNRYVVSSDDYPQDAIVQTSKGEGRVYDSGSGEGNIDMYVSW